MNIASDGRHIKEIAESHRPATSETMPFLVKIFRLGRLKEGRFEKCSLARAR